MKTALATLLIVFSISATSYAADGSSGCGPGWFVLKDNSLVSSFLRSMTNAILFPTTTVGMTVGTSNCTKHKIVETEKETIHFATHNFYEILNEGARGQGTTLAAFADTIGCKASVRAHFSEKFQQNYSEIMNHSQQGPNGMVLEVYKMILNDRSLTDACSMSLT